MGDEEKIAEDLKMKVVVEKDDDPNFIPSDQLDERKEASIRRSENVTKAMEQRLPTGELVRNKHGKVVKEVKLVYNTKKDFETPAERKYKTDLCAHYPNCLNGENCKYAHGEEEQKLFCDVQKCLEAYYDKAKIETLDHFELCQNQQCPLRLRLLLRKTVICKFWEEGNCNKGVKCGFAHGNSERVPLPKKELCRKFQSHECNLNNTECVYAHGRDELREKGAQKVYDADGDSAQAVDTADDEEDIEDVNPELLCGLCEDLRETIPPQAIDRYITMARKS